MTAREAAVLRDRIARARLNLAAKSQHPPARTEGTVNKLEKRIRHLELTITDLHSRLDAADHRTEQADRRARQAEHERDLAAAETRQARQLLHNVANRKHLDAERHVIQLRARIRELEQAAGYTDAEGR